MELVNAVKAGDPRWRFHDLIGSAHLPGALRFAHAADAGPQARAHQRIDPGFAPLLVEVLDGDSGHPVGASSAVARGFREA